MSLTKEVIPVAEVQATDVRITKLKDQMEAIKVTTPEELNAVAEHIASVKQAAKDVTEVRDKYIEPAKSIIEHAKATFDPIINRCKDIETFLKNKAQEYMLAEKKKADEKAAKEAAKVESGYQKPETAAKKIAEIPEAQRVSKTDKSTLSMKMVKDYRIIDEKKIPEEYYKPRELDTAKIRKVALAGIAIPGVEVFEKPQMDSRAR